MSPERMIRNWCVFLLFALAGGTALAQDTLVTGTVTYKAGDAVYVSLGKNAGVADSTTFWITSHSDTIALLRVFATSSKSSVCRIVTSTKEIHVGDAVSGYVKKLPTPVHTELSNASGAEPGRSPGVGVASSQRDTSPPPALKVAGRVSLQYLRSSFNDGASVSTQPGMVLDFRSAMRDIPLSFELYGNFRVRNVGPEVLWGANSTNQTRIYRLATTYDDTVHRISVGRLYATAMPTAGMIDGLLYSHTWNTLSVGTAFGFDATTSSGGFSSIGKKFVLFGAYRTPDAWNGSYSIGYMRAYESTLINREMMSASVMLTPSNTVYFSMMSDMDLRTKSGSEFRYHPVLSSLYSSMSYRATSFFSLGMGLTSWRPVYLYSAVANIPDTQLDQTLRTNPTITVTVYPVNRVMMYDSYSPRTGSGSGEYLNYASCTVTNMWVDGLSATVTWNLNAAVYSTTRGYSAGARYSAGVLGDFGLRYQMYQYSIPTAGSVPSSKSIIADMLFLVSRKFTVATSLEKMSGGWSDGYVFMLDTGLRF